MWILYAFGSALFAGLTSILAKCGIKKTDSTVATAIRTIVVLLMSYIMVVIMGSQGQLTEINTKTWIFLVLSGMATGGSWLCYFKALQLGDVNKVVPVDKSSTVLTIILAFLFLHEGISLLKALCVAFIGAGTYMMNQKKEGEAKNSKNGWFLYASLSAVFAALTSILGKIGIEGVESTLGTTIRTFVVLIMAWIMVFATGKARDLKSPDKGELIRDGKDAAIFAVGSMVVPAQAAAERLAAETGLEAAVFDARWVKPLPEKQLLELAGRFDRILCIEENALEGGFSSAVLELLSDNGALKGQHIRRMGLPDAFIEHGAQPLLRGNLGLDADGILAALRDLLRS